MATVNKVTSLFPAPGSTIADSDIQSHIEEQNSQGYYLISVINLIGWYRFFWAKTVE